MKRFSLTLFFIVLFGLICISCDEPIPDGILPKGYEWAYGLWESDKQDGLPIVSLYIGDRYIQYNAPFFYGTGVEGKVEDELPPIYCFPKMEYTVKYKEVPSREVDQSNDKNEVPLIVDNSELSLNYEEAVGCEIITLKKKDKCVHCQVNDRPALGCETIELKKKDKRVAGLLRERNEVQEEIVEQYNKRYKESSVWGEWISQGQDYDWRILVPYEEMNVITNDGRYLLAPQGGAFSVDGDDIITLHYLGWHSYETRRYYRYDEKKELEDRISGLAFSRMWHTGQSTMMIKYDFGPNKRGQTVLYAIDFWKRELVRNDFKWEAVDGSTIRVYVMPVSEYSYEDFTVVQGLFTYIVGEDGVRFTLDR